jgi:uncharacterized protein YkwD
MRLHRFLKWLIGLVIVILAVVVLRSWTPGPAAAQSGAAVQVYFPLIARYPTPTPTKTPVPTPTSSCPSHYGSYELELYDMINEERANAGLSPLAPHYSLETSAGEHSDDMAVNHFLSHTGSDGSTACQRVVAAGYLSSWCAEIIMYANSPQAAMDWWMNEPLHRDMILGPFNDFGAGYAKCAGDYAGYFTVDFGHR